MRLSLSPNLFSTLKFETIQLGLSDRELLVLLHHEVQKETADDKRSLAIRTPDDYSLYLSDPHYTAGVVDGNQLIGAGCLVKNTHKNEPDGIMNCPLVRDRLSEFKTVGVICAVKTHPLFVRRGVMNAVLTDLRAHALQREYPLLLAQIVEENEASAAGFEKAGFEEWGTPVRHSDGRKRRFFAQRLQ